MDQQSLAAWRAMQDGFASLTGFSLLTFDSQLAPLCPPSQDNPICAAVQKSDLGAQHCRAHCGKAVATALKTKELAFFRCEANLHVFTAPVIIGDQVWLVLQGGKRFLTDVEREPTDRLTQLTGLSPEAFRSLAQPQPTSDPAQLVSAARYLQQVGRYLFEGEHARTLSAKFSFLLTLFTLVGELKQDADLESFYSTVLSSIGVLFGVSTAAVLTVNLSENTVAVKQPFGRKKDLLRGYRPDVRGNLIEEVLTNRRRRSTREPMEILKMGLPAEIESVELLPMFLQEGQAAVLVLILDSSLSEQDLQIIEAFCIQAGLVLQNRLLLDHFHEGTRHLTAITKIIQELASTLDADQLYELILDRSAELVQAEKGSLMLLNEQEGNLAIKAVKGLNKKLLEPVRVAPNEGISGRVAASGEPLLVSDLEADERVAQKQKPRYRTKSFISIPLKLEHRTIGVLNISDKITGDVFSRDDLERLVSLAEQASVAIERSVFNQRFEELKRVSILDSLTGLVNRRHFEERLMEEVLRAKRHQLPLSLVMVDLDNFKTINDSYGHQAGDEALRISARVIRNTIRTIDLAARYGGEEFAIILPQTAKPGAAIIADRICSEFRKLDLPFPRKDSSPMITGSLGLACFTEEIDSPEDLIRQADIALYRAKAQGKNRVVVYGDV